MEDQLSYFIVIVLTFLFIAWKWKFSSKPKDSNKPINLPPGPRKWPLIGHLHLLGNLPHRSLQDLAMKYGHVMLLQLGEVPTVVITSSEAAKQVMKDQDANFAERPYLYAAETITYNFQDLVFARGDHRRWMRKVCVAELLNSRRVQSFRGTREKHVSNLVRSISEKEGSTINLRNMLYSTSIALVSDSAFGGKCKHQETFKNVVPEIVSLLAGLSVVDLYPSLRILHLINKMRPKCRRLHKKVDNILESIIDEHKADRSTGEEEDFVQVLLNVQERGESFLSNTSMKALILDMFTGSSETSAITLEWAMAELVKNPQVMAKAQAEVRQVFGEKGYVNESELGKLKYLNQVIKESFRLHPIGPLLLPREAMEACEISGFQIPSKTRVMVNVFAIMRDPNLWDEADKFNPERFADSSIDYKGLDFELLPFGAGRRMCPGMSYGMATVELTLANLLYHFDWKLPNGMKPEEFDTTEVFSSVIRIKNDLRLVPFRYNN